MTLAQLRYLVAIIDANLNITLAAERVNATQPGISKQLKVLEEELGFQIFIRKGKALERLSPAGAQVVERSRRILAEAANIRTLAENHRQEPKGELVIATTQTQARFVLPRALKTLKAGYPDVSVRINMFADAGRAEIAKQDADILIASSVEWPHTPDLVVPLYNWDRVAVAPLDHPLAKLGRPLTLQDLAEHPLIGYESALGSHARVAEAFARANAPANFAYAAHDTEVIKTFVRSGFGVGLLAEMAMEEADADLTKLPVSGLPSCTAYALLRRDRVARTYVLDLLSEVAPHVNRREIVRALQPGSEPFLVKAPDWRAWKVLVNRSKATSAQAA
ncbi:MAG TPA: LysR substrate-binding domain-containing protein [Phenylobacterium sp.]|nr:LysR substrate-binding domain-containing protein [Phenylobacterium sp.]